MKNQTESKNKIFVGLTKERLEEIKNKIQNSSPDCYDFIVDFKDRNRIEKLIKNLPITDERSFITTRIWEQYISLNILKSVFERGFNSSSIDYIDIISLYNDLMSEDYRLFNETELIDIYTVTVFLKTINITNSRIHYFIDGKIDIYLKELLDNILASSCCLQNVIYTTNEYDEILSKYDENIISINGCYSPVYCDNLSLLKTKTV